MARRKCCSFGLRDTGSAMRTGTARRKRKGCPAIFRIAGRTNNAKVTMVLTGFPGNQKNLLPLGLSWRENLLSIRDKAQSDYRC